MNLKSCLSLIITIAFTSAFCYVVYKFADVEMSKSVVTAFLTVATSVIGYFIGYQANKKNEKKEEEE